MQFINDHLYLLLIPFINGIVGWITNYLALKMMFYPLEFVGKKPFFGWQGIVPSRARQMAEIEVDLILGKLLSLDEIAARVDPKVLTKIIRRRLKQSIHRIVHDVMRDAAPAMWASLPSPGKALVYSSIEADIPRIVPKLVSDIQHNIREMLDLKTMIVKRMENQPELVNEIFLTAGDKEFKFIEHSGLYFGFLLGLPIAGLWAWTQNWWVLPAGGLLVGWITNWLAIHIIFEPKQPILLGPFRIQGLFLKRQKEVSRIYSQIIAEKIVNSETMVEAVMKNGGADHLMELIEMHVNDAVDRYLTIAQPYFSLSIGSDNYFTLKQAACKRIFEDSETIFLYAHEYADSALKIGEELEEKLKQLPPEQFEGVMRPAYQADEWKLIVVGALLGMCAGMMQLYWVV